MKDWDSMSDGINNAVHSAVKSEWLTVIARGSMIFSNLLVIWLFTTVNQTNLKIVELNVSIDALESRVVSVERSLSDTNDDINKSRMARQKDWQEVRERLAKVETRAETIMDTAKELLKKVDSISDRLPRREGELQLPKSR